MTKPLTPSELDTEYRYRYEERLGILCGSNTATPRQKAMAHEEATRAVDALKPIDNPGEME